MMRKNHEIHEQHEKNLVMVKSAVRELLELRRMVE